MHSLKRVAAVALVSAAGAAGIALASAGTASAAPTYIGPLYYESTEAGIFAPSPCRQAVTAERADGNIILIDCAPDNPWYLFRPPHELRVGIDVNGS
ncbi:hypothetical protein GCM10007304_14650 [Rhodococcoides trifolii]|uniref:Secreted protein n=1 Tax=Rhodococcoides trifolii TaxID=908250 RepID=A0A917CWW8_9NOCA|nr:hypothetical protein [Rhodococcus trifolii]GGG01726.1 hypothetical protein GCM10007304_14650 [Rhodococcus trifolii]